MRCQEDVPRLQVAMDDSATVRRIQRVADFNRASQLSQRFPSRYSEDQVVDCVLNAYVVELADMGMVERRNARASRSKRSRASA